MAETPSVTESRWGLLTLFILFRWRERWRGEGGRNDRGVDDRRR